jgi:hypothetical protein
VATDNRSIPYNEERAAVRDWLSTTKDGAFAVEQLQKEAGSSALKPEKRDAGDILTNDQHVDWPSVYREHKDDLAVAYNSRAAAEAFKIDARIGNDAWIRFFQCPGWLFFRRQIENMDPEYWNDPKNVLREAMAFPDFCTVPQHVIRAELDKYLGKAHTRLIVAPGEAGLFRPFHSPGDPSTVDILDLDIGVREGTPPDGSVGSEAGDLG